MKRVCVFCGSSPGIRKSYAIAATQLAENIVARGFSIVYGGGNVGLMGILADAALNAGGKVIGVIPSVLASKELAHSRLTELRVVGSMHERKALMAELSDAFIAMPGGYGTFEEFCEILTWTQLGLERSPCGLLNIDGYYDHLLKLFDHAMAEQFVKPVHRRMVLDDPDPAGLVAKIQAYSVRVVDKWIDFQQT